MGQLPRAAESKRPQNGQPSAHFMFKKMNFRAQKYLSTFAKLRRATISFVMSVCPHGTTRLLLEGFS